MSLESLQQAVKDVILGSMVSFTTVRNGEGFCGVQKNDLMDYKVNHSNLMKFRDSYLAFYGLSEEDIEGLPPWSLMFHVFGIKDKAVSSKDFGSVDGEFLDCLINLYRQCGLTEIKKDE